MKNFSTIEDVGTVRLKIIQSCNWSCHFCHDEGAIQAEMLQWDSSLESALTRLRDELGVKELHLTGGEPSLNKHIGSIIQGSHDLGMVVKMTSNGQFPEVVRESLVSSGIEAINFSLQSVHPEHLRDMMEKTKSTEWASQQIQQAQANITALHHQGIKVRVNCVLSSPEDIDRVTGVLDWATGQGVETRVLDDLCNKNNSSKGIQQLLNSYGAKLKKTIFVPGTSSSRYIYETATGKEFTVKQIEQVYLPGLCESCEHFGSETCHEGFYNIRLQKSRSTGEFIVVLCIQNQNTESVLSLDQFLSLYHSKQYAIPSSSGGIGNTQTKRIIPIRAI